MSRMILIAAGLLACSVSEERAGVVVRDVATELTTTEIVGHPDAPHGPGRNLLWCLTLERAWSEAAARLGVPLRLEGDPPLAERLGRGDAAPEDVDAGSMVARAGLGREGIVEAIRAELREKFGDRAGPELLPDAVPDDDLLAYAYLLKSLRFAEPFLVDGGPIVFDGVPVESFGVRHEEGATEAWEEIARQVRVLDHRGATEFVVELLTESAGDRLVLARVPPGETLEATIDDVTGRVVGATPEPLRPVDTFLAPKVEFDLTQSFPDLVGRRVLDLPGRVVVDDVRQRIAFRLDERGAELESEAVMVLRAAAVLDARRLVFDGPFLVMLLREGAARPFFAAWIETPELLLPIES